MIEKDERVTAYLYGKHLELTRNTMANGTVVKKLDNDTYKVEYPNGSVSIGKYNRNKKGRTETRLDNIDSIKKSFRQIRRIVNANFDGSDNELWITLTYAENMQDTDRLYKDFKKFMTRLRRKTGLKIDYLSVIEPQSRGAWHIHALFKDFEHESLYIDSDLLAKCWGQGFVKVKKLKQSDNVAAYLSAYISDIPVGDEVDENGKPKKIKKGERLYLYPTGVNIYRTSRGIKRPQKVKGTKQAVLDTFEFNEDIDLAFDNSRELIVNGDKEYIDLEIFEKDWWKKNGETDENL